jgi:hypothetical protein
VGWGVGNWLRWWAEEPGAGFVNTTKFMDINYLHNDINSIIKSLTPEFTLTSLPINDF